MQAGILGNYKTARLARQGRNTRSSTDRLRSPARTGRIRLHRPDRAGGTEDLGIQSTLDTKRAIEWPEHKGIKKLLRELRTLRTPKGL